MQPEHPYNAMLEAAIAARRQAYVPVSRYAVGAAILSAKGCIYAGCNIEDAAFNSSLHAEQTAIAHMRLAEGDAARIAAVVVVATAPGREPTLPCGHCRQFIGEFVEPDTGPVAVRSYNPDGELTGDSTWQALLPQAFSGRAFIA